MANRITTIFEVVTDKAATSLKSFKQSITDADGASGKLKAGWSSATSAISENAGALAVAGGAALVTFGLKAVGAFTDTAKAAIDLGKSTGLSTEAASRWIGVGDDYLVSAEALTSGLGKLGKTLDSGKWEKYGIATRDAAGHARDANAVLVDALSTISDIKNPLEQARVGTDLFGKGFANLSPLLGHTKDEYEKMLGSVEKGQVITADEAAKAERWRLAEDKLKDALHEITLSVGEQVTALAPLLDVMTKVVSVQDKLKGTAQGSLPFLDDIGKVTNAWHYFTDDAEAATKAIGNSQTATDGYSYALQDVARSQAEAEAKYTSSTTSLTGYSYAATDAAATTKRLKDAQDEATRAAKVFSDALQGQLDKLEALYPKQYDAVKAKYDFADAQAKALIDTDKLNKAVGDDQAAAFDTARDSIIAASEKYGTMEGAANGSEGAIRRQIESLKAQEASLAPGSPLRAFLDQYIADLNNIPSNISTIMDLHISTGSATTAAGDVIGKRSGRFAAGGDIPWDQDVSLVGENGPELIHAPGAHVTPNDVLGGSTTNHITINMPVGTDGDDVVNAIRTFERRNGAGWRS